MREAIWQVDRQHSSHRESLSAIHMCNYEPFFSHQKLARESFSTIREEREKSFTDM